jgi:hypothetical protein
MLCLQILTGRVEQDIQYGHLLFLRSCVNKELQERLIKTIDEKYTVLK